MQFCKGKLDHLRTPKLGLGYDLIFAILVCVCRLRCRCEGFGVVGRDYLCHIFGATVADFDIVSIQDFVESVLLGKVFVNELQKQFVDVCGN